MASSGVMRSSVFAVLLRAPPRAVRRLRRSHYRAVPAEVIDAPDLAHDLRAVQRSGRAARTRLWPWARETSWRRVTAVMRAAGLHGPQATPRARKNGGLRLQCGGNRGFLPSSLPM